MSDPSTDPENVTEMPAAADAPPPPAPGQMPDFKGLSSQEKSGLFAEMKGQLEFQRLVIFMAWQNAIVAKIQNPDGTLQKLVDNFAKWREAEGIFGDILDDSPPHAANLCGAPDPPLTRRSVFFIGLGIASIVLSVTAIIVALH